MRTVAVLACVAAALGAGAVASSAQDSRDVGSAPTLDAALAAECARPLPAPATGAPAALLEFEGIQGESTAAGHLDESEAETFRIGAAAPGGHGPLVLGKPYDKASPQVHERLVSGTTIPKVVLTQQKSAGVFLKYRLTGVNVIDVEHTGRVAANTDRVCLSFDQGEVEYRPLNNDGTLGLPAKQQF
jgi:type VI protein secretion system component Hcp